MGWLRASVLGANDGIVSTASLILGVAASGAGSESVLVTGIAGLAAGAMSMAAGEYVSVSSQADAEAADLIMNGYAVDPTDVEDDDVEDDDVETADAPSVDVETAKPSRRRGKA